MQVKSKMVLMLSLVMGIITTILFFQYMKQLNTEKVATASVQTVGVVVAKEKIEKNEKISSEKLRNRARVRERRASSSSKESF